MGSRGDGLLPMDYRYRCVVDGTRSWRSVCHSGVDIDPVGTDLLCLQR